MSRRHPSSGTCPDCGHVVSATLDGELRSHACSHRRAVARFGFTVTCDVDHPLKDVHWHEASFDGRERWTLRCCNTSLTVGIARLELLAGPVRAAGLERVPLALLVAANARL